MSIGRVFLILSMNDINKMTKKEILDYLRTMDDKSVKTASTDEIERHFENALIETRCPNCYSPDKYSNGTNNSGSRRYKCKKCGKEYTAITNTIFEGTDYTWSEMVDIVFYIITGQTIKFICSSIRTERINNYNIWLIQHKLFKRKDSRLNLAVSFFLLIYNLFTLVFSVKCSISWRSSIN